MKVHPWTKLVVLLVAPGLLLGCDSEAVLGAPEQIWLWLAVPLLGFLIGGGAFMAAARGAQMRHWDLRRNQSDRGVRGVVIAIFVVALLIAMAFGAYHLPLQIDPRQKLYNFGLWFLGSVIGALLGIVIGLRIVEPRPQIHDDGRN